MLKIFIIILLDLLNKFINKYFFKISMLKKELKIIELILDTNLIYKIYR